MRVYISADIEGVCGICHWDEANLSHAENARFRTQMQREVNAACRGALSAGATEIRVRDAHATGRNLDPWALPREAHLVREWSGDPMMMVQELDAGFSAVMFVGYHARGGSGGNPLAHTLTGAYAEIRVNGSPMSELDLYSLSAASLGVPAVFVSGDAALCRNAQARIPGLRTVSTNVGRGRSIIARHPQIVVEEIEEAAAAGLTAPPPVQTLPAHFQLEVDYRDQRQAYRGSFYPGARLVGPRRVALDCTQWVDVTRALVFLK